jgi:acetoin utilization deacetylase AcuC-like enzyme
MHDLGPLHNIPDRDTGVALFYHPAFLEHDTGYHPESPDRLRAIVEALDAHGIPPSCLLRPEPVDMALLQQVHDARYIAAVQRVAGSGGAYWDVDTYISPRSYQAALLAAGAAVAAVDSVMRAPGGADAPADGWHGPAFAFALVRPPGHHALYDSAMGFCIFNNVAVAAQHATTVYGLERVLIVDWDVHHGNGTQDYFYQRADVLFFSTHRYPFYPGTGAAGDTGSGEGAGYTVNLPLPVGVGDEGYRRVFEEILVPVAERYRPQLILISAGYDAHMADPLGGMAVTVAGFYEMARIVCDLAVRMPECRGRVAAVLEGGYDIRALAASVLATIAAMIPGSAPGERQYVPATEGQGGQRQQRWAAPDITTLIQQVKRIHKL